jgi:AraC-like DNA-binding protein
MVKEKINRFDIPHNNTNWLTIVRNIKFDHRDYDETQPHKHKFYEFLLFEKGEGVHVIDDKEYPLRDKSIHFISPNHVHQLKISKETSGIVCMFKEELFYINNEDKKFLNEVELFSDWNESPVLDIPDENFIELKNSMQQLLEEYDNAQAHRNNVMYMLLKIFLIKASRLSNKQNRINKNSKSLFMERFLLLVEENHNQNKPIQYYADQLNITAIYLNRIIKENYGKSASDFISDRVILEAKRVLKYSQKTIKEIAFELGFDDPSYFSRFFKKRTNSTPVEYRQQVN